VPNIALAISSGIAVMTIAVAVQLKPGTRSLASPKMFPEMTSVPLPKEKAKLGIKLSAEAGAGIKTSATAAAITARYFNGVSLPTYVGVSRRALNALEMGLRRDLDLGLAAKQQDGHQVLSDLLAFSIDGGRKFSIGATIVSQVVGIGRGHS